jgi:hypothetical protein
LALFTAFAVQSAEKLPDMALLEYLAELVEVDGELVGPMDMAENVETEQDEQDTGSQQQTQEPKSTTDIQPKGQEDKAHD